MSYPNYYQIFRGGLSHPEWALTVSPISLRDLLLLLYKVFYHAGIKALHVTKQENLIRQFAA